jgi:hypothetical protein
LEEPSSRRLAIRATGRLALIVFVSLLPRAATAEKVLAVGDGWQFFTDGRVGGFVSWVYGQGYPAPTYGVDANGQFVNTPIFTAKGGGFNDVTEQGSQNDPTLNIPPGVMVPNQGTIRTVSIRSGFVTNLLGFGFRDDATPRTSVEVYVQLWMFIESAGRLVNVPSYPDAKQGYAKLEGPWGSFLVGRTRALFSRGLADIEVLYHGPTEIDRIHYFGGNFVSGFIYGTPAWHGLELDVGLFDPFALETGSWTRTKYPRAEAELSFERKLGGGWGKVVLFADGAYQKAYENGYCQPATDPASGSPRPCEQTLAGVGYGGRLDLGPIHFGAAGYYEGGLGINDPLEIEDADQDPLGIVRKFAGMYVQSRIELGKIDLFAGWGLVRAFASAYDRTHTAQDPRDPTNPDAQIFPFSIIRAQTGLNGGVIYHVTPNLHCDLDFIREQADWTPVNGYPGQRQVVYIANTGVAANW